MYKVLIVEDMDITREDIMELIEWKSYDFELVPSARNGKIGLEYAVRYLPDIILTDIKMPVMTGLELVEQMKKIRPKTKFILLTAYEEFELAKKALDMGIQSFLLKYEISPELLLQELNKCVEEIEKERNLEKLTLRRRLERLLSDTTGEEYIEKKYFQWVGRSYLLDLWILKASVEIGEENLQDILKKELNKYQFICLGIQPREYIFFLQIMEFRSQQEQNFYLRSFILSLQNVFASVLNTGTAIAVGGYVENQHAITECRKKAADLLSYHIFYKGSCILEDIREENESTADFSRELKNIQEMLKNNEYEQVRRDIKKLYLDDMVKYKNISLLKKVTIKITHFFRERGYEIKLSEFDVYLESVWANLLTDSIFHTEERFQYLLDILSECTDKMYSKKVRAAMNYVRKHFTEEIGLNEVADKLEVSPIYLSHLFKRETGITFSAYITKLRIERAKELLRQGDKKIYEISELVGYQTVQYFSKVFKRETGKTPKEYE